MADQEPRIVSMGGVARPHDPQMEPNAPKAGELRAFTLERDEDESGISGTGTVAWGVVFPDGVVALRWSSEWPTSVVFHDRGIEAVRAVHGHRGKTRIVWHR